MKLRTLALSLSVSWLVLAPVSALAAERTPRGDITIEWNGEFDRAHGVRSGSGTHHDPFVISGWELTNLTIRDTDRVVRIIGNTISGTLTLDWIGSEITVQNNDIGDLRVNQNVARWGAPSAGVIARNRIGVVGQLRHYDGWFVRNVVGVPGGDRSSFPETRAVNLDGFNGAHIAHNTIYGFMDARLHGHHHASEFGALTHGHTSNDPTSHTVDHSKRYHEVHIHDNAIFSGHTYALAYLDTNHAANDRTADSETNPYLNAPHVHHTRAHLMDNALDGAGLLVNVFNAQDERHRRLANGRLNIMGNEVTLGWNAAKPLQELNGIEVRDARNLRLDIAMNQVTGAAPTLEAFRPIQVNGAGVVLDAIDVARVTVRDLVVINRRVGVSASRMTSSVDWAIEGLRTTGVEQPVAYDGSVQNPPESA